MNDNSLLLEQLRIDRGVERPTDPRPGWLLWAGGAFALAALGMLAWWLLTRNAPVAVQPVVVTPVATRATTGTMGASMLDASGYVVAQRSATVASKITGRLAEVLIEEGQKVAKDQILARLDASNVLAMLAESTAQLAEAEADRGGARLALDDAQKVFDRISRERDAGFVSAQALDTARATYNLADMAYTVKDRSVDVARARREVVRRQLADTVVRAPFAGIVTATSAQLGEIVSPVSAGGGFTRTGICTIIDMDSLVVEVDVSENFIDQVRAGGAATMKLNAYPQWTIPASVIAVIPTADRSKATVRVRVAFTQKDERILPEMGVRVSFLRDPTRTAARVEPPAR